MNRYLLLFVNNNLLIIKRICLIKTVSFYFHGFLSGMYILLFFGVISIFLKLIKVGTSLAIDTKTGQRRVVLAYEILLLFFGNGIVHSDAVNDIFQSLTMCTLTIKQVLLKYRDSPIFNWHSKFANCLIWAKVDVLPYTVFLISPKMEYLKN